MVVVRDWAREMIYMSDPFKYSTNFLTTFMRSAILSVDHDGQNAFDYVSRAPCMLYTNPPQVLIRRDCNIYIVKDLVTMLLGRDPWCLSAGVLFVRYAKCLGFLRMSLSYLFPG